MSEIAMDVSVVVDKVESLHSLLLGLGAGERRILRPYLERKFLELHQLVAE